MSLSHSPSIVTSGLVLCYDAANPRSYPGSGTVWADISGSNNVCTLVNGPTFSSSNSGSILFDGINDYSSVPYNSVINSATTFTLDIWFQSALAGTEQVLFGTSTPAGGWHVELYTSKILLQVFPGGAYTFSTAVLSSSTVYCLTVTYSAGSIVYYINGASAGTASYTFTPNTNTLIIGGYSYTLGSYGWNGNIYSVKFYTQTFSATQVTQNFNALRGRYGI